MLKVIREQLKVIKLEKLSTSALNNKSKDDYISRLITHNIKDEPKLFKAISSIIRDCF